MDLEDWKDVVAGHVVVGVGYHLWMDRPRRGSSWSQSLSAMSLRSLVDDSTMAKVISRCDEGFNLV
jgi:hypothetical protein